jgi:hypothetical protein
MMMHFIAGITFKEVVVDGPHDVGCSALVI